MADAALVPPPMAPPNGLVPSPQASATAPLAPGPDGDVAMQNGPLVNGEDAEAEGLPAEANETVYLNNLNERVKPDVMKQTLKNLFRNYGPVLSVTAHSSVRMRGQAFVAFPDKEMAHKAVKEIKGFPLYGKPIEAAFAKTQADSVVKRQRPDDFDAHKDERSKRKKASRGQNPLRKKFVTQAKAARAAAEASGDLPAAAPSQRRIVQMPDEYQPPNKILFVQNLPETATKEALDILFKQYANLIEVRTIPGRSNIAFVEYTDATSSGVAKDALHNYKFDGEHKIKVTFAKQ